MFALVTGPTGFLGSHLVERLLGSGHTVRALVYEPDKASNLPAGKIDMVRGDITSPLTLVSAMRGVDVVFHTAALVTDWAPWERFLDVTVKGTENVLNAAVQADVKRFLHVSTIRVYDDRHCRREGVATEKTPLGRSGFRPFGRYARAKVLAEKAVWRESRRLPVTVLRPAWIYGPRDETIIPPLLRFLRSPAARWPGFVDPCADPVFVTDVADCAIAAALSPAAAGQAYNVAPPERITVREFLGPLLAALHCSMPRGCVPYFLAALAARTSEWWARMTWKSTPPAYTRAGLAILTQDVRHDPAKAQADFGWRTKISLREGVSRTVAWLKERHPELLVA